MSKLSIKWVNVDYVVAVAISFYFVIILSFLSFMFFLESCETNENWVCGNKIIFDGNIIRNRKQVVLTVYAFLAIFAKRIKMTQYLILLKQGSNIISYNSKQRSNVSRTFLFIKKKTLSIARVSFNEPRLPKNTLGINGIVFFCF